MAKLQVKTFIIYLIFIFCLQAALLPSSSLCHSLVLLLLFVAKCSQRLYLQPAKGGNIMTPERRQKLLAVLNKRQPDLTVVMENVEDPHNISAVMRTCDAVGIQHIYILNTKIPRHKKWGAKSSSSASKWLTIHQFNDVNKCVEALRNGYKKIFTTHLAVNSVSLYDIDFTESVALVFGNEHEGVSEELRSIADGNFIIPQMGIIQSLNISVACAVSIYEAFRQKQIAGDYAKPALPEEMINAYMKQWGDYNADE